MKLFLVGGAIRDTLLGLPITDKDWVVVNATAQDMINAGYLQVGRGFPVFLHPQTREEYALARTEKKSGLGYVGFSCDFSPDITLEQDLQRRDLTINALAQNEEGKIIDLWGGLNDLKHGILRHVSPAFIEDPLRVLRVARFAACYAHLNFYVEQKTMKLMKDMSARGELVHLTPERIWQETKKALHTRNPHVYFEVLRSCGALKTIFPEIDALFRIPTKMNLHTETDAGINALVNLNTAALLSSEIDVRFAALCCDLRKGLIPKHLWPDHNNHSSKGVELVEQICQRLRIPKKISNLAKLITRFQHLIHNFSNLKPETIVKFFDNINAWRTPKNVEKIALISEVFTYKKMNLENNNFSHSWILREIWKTVKTISTSKIIESNVKGVNIKKELIKHRTQAITNWKNSTLIKQDKYNSSEKK